MNDGNRNSGDPFDPMRDFEEIENHRYDPGYWVTSWYSSARRAPPYGYISPGNMSAGFRAALLALFVSGFSYALFGRLRFDVPHFWWYIGGYTAVLYIVMLVLVRRSLAKNKLRGKR